MNEKMNKWMNEWMISLIFVWRYSFYSPNLYVYIGKVKGTCNSDLRVFVNTSNVLRYGSLNHSFTANNTISSFICKHSPGGSTTHIRIAKRTPEFNLLLIYRPQEDEWLSWPCWLTYSGRFTPRSAVNCMSWRRPGKFAGHRPTF